MKLILVEHAQSEANARGVSQGQKDYELTELGFEQAKRIALRLRSEKIDFAYSSDLSRAIATAEEILKFHPKTKLACLKELREQKKGFYEGKSHKILYSALKKAGVPYYEFDFNGGETSIKVQDRMKLFYNNILNKHIDKTVLVVTHGGPMTTLLLFLLNKDFKDYKKYCPTNASISLIKINNSKQVKTKILNSTDHLISNI
ncbi:histidine phosphatase family protein [Candidatus Woesearchaeota archaeon]|nr:histidine phosphatase family protein [Candidatus Woesearchaeota archaeon]